METRNNKPIRRVDKLKEVFLYMIAKIGCNPITDLLTINIILYFIDFDYYEKYEEQIIGLEYTKTDCGPKPSKQILAKQILELLWQPEYIMDLDEESYLKSLNDLEKKHIDYELYRLSKLSFIDLCALLSDDVPWVTAEENESIEYESVFYRDITTTFK